MVCCGVCVCVVCTCSCVQAWKSEVNTECLCLLLVTLFFFKDTVTASHWTQSSTIQLYLLASEGLWSTHVYFQSAGVIDMCFMWVLGIWNRSPLLHDRQCKDGAVPSGDPVTLDLWQHTKMGRSSSGKLLTSWMGGEREEEEGHGSHFILGDMSPWPKDLYVPLRAPPFRVTPTCQ